MYTSKTLEYLFQGFHDLFEQSETYCFELHCCTARFIFIIFIIIVDFMSHWSLVVFCQNYIVPLPVLFLLFLLLLMIL